MLFRKLLRNFTHYKKTKNKTQIQVKKTIKKQNILITGANSGIGLALTKKFIMLDYFVIATFNKRKDNLVKLKVDNLEICQCDQSQIENIDELIKFIKNIPINVIINNAAISGGKNQDFFGIDFKQFVNATNVNAISILKIIKIVLKYSKKNSLKSILNISSHYSSIGNNLTGNDYIYKSTKSMMNAFSKNLSVDLKRDFGVSVFSVCPGNVKTKLNPRGKHHPDLIVTKIVDILESAETLNGKFIDLNKNNITW